MKTTHLEALADAVRHEYRSSVEAGPILQIDCPDLAMGRHLASKHETDEQFLGHVHQQIEALGHAHEWAVFERMKARLPDDKALIAGVIQSSSNCIEDPELVAQRIERFAGIVSRERVLAGSNCGFSTFAGDSLVDPEIVFAKLHAVIQGATIASRRLWPH